mmetsp:Transcript_19611/g.29760  ORF Transcript_19611/g.29760 Transcript_19611/m.29760 type:complete len:87 (+) Transcript_19611:181-441(+)
MTEEKGSLTSDFKATAKIADKLEKKVVNLKASLQECKEIWKASSDLNDSLKKKMEDKSQAVDAAAKKVAEEHEASMAKIYKIIINL